MKTKLTVVTTFDRHTKFAATEAIKQLPDAKQLSNYLKWVKDALLPVTFQINKHTQLTLSNADRDPY